MERSAVAEAGMTPLQYMLSVLRDETVEPERRDEMAKAAAPYIHPRLSNVGCRVAPVVTSGKLPALMQMLHELASEGRRVLVFAVHLDARFDQARACYG